MAPSRGTVVAGAIGVGLLGVLLLQGSPEDGPPLDPRSDAPDGTSALVALLEELGADVELSVGLPDADDDVALVLVDRLDEDQTEQVLAWTRAGGTLVVTDPESSLTPEVFRRAAARRRARRARDLHDRRARRRGGGRRRASRSATTPAAAHSSCLGSRDFAFVAARSEGAGDVVSIGGADFATNERLDHDDNAVLAAGAARARAGHDRAVRRRAAAGRWRRQDAR